jgi:GxxExxY protein
MSSILHRDLTQDIIRIFYEVYNELGYGFLERVYQNALFYELKANGFDAKAQHKIKVFYKEVEVGEYICDILVNDLIILELKAQEQLIEANEFQLINYLKATDYEVGLLLNFGKKAEFKRKIFQNNIK